MSSGVTAVAATIAETAAAAVGVVLLFDVLGALAARKFRFAYGALAVPSLILFLLLGLVVQATLLDARLVAAVAALAAVVEASAGHALVQRIGPPRPPMRAAQLLVGSLVGIVSETAIAFVGATWLFAGVVWYVTHRH